MKHSIRRQLALIFIAFILALFALCILANTFFLENYYILNKKNTLISNYNKLQTQIYDGNDADLLLNMEELLANFGISAILMDSSGRALKAVSSNDTLLKMQFYQAVLNSADDQKVMEKNQDYTILRISDKNINSDYLILWGITSQGDYLMLRTTVNSIKESVNTSNTFMIYTIIIGTCIASVCIYFISRRFTNPILELAEISIRMSNLEFETKYRSHKNNEIDILGENMNQLSIKLESTISELKTTNAQLENELRIKDQIDEARREFLANVSHELKTPISVIQGYAEGLRECVNDDEASRNAYCDIIIDEAARMNHFVKQLLTLNQLEQGRNNINMERFNLVSLIKGKMTRFEINAAEKEVEFKYHGPDTIYVWSDSFAIEDALTNYISNAFNHVRPGGQIIISADIIEDRTIVSVFNTGDHIDEAEMDKIWDKLYKIDKARTRAYGGNGIGLSIVKAVMDLLNCNYGVNNVDNGVSFWFDIKND